MHEDKGDIHTYVTLNLHDLTKRLEKVGVKINLYKALLALRAHNIVFTSVHLLDIPNLYWLQTSFFDVEEINMTASQQGITKTHYIINITEEGLIHLAPLICKYKRL
jgi:hypothetical protein